MAEFTGSRSPARRLRPRGIAPRAQGGLGTSGMRPAHRRGCCTSAIRRKDPNPQRLQRRDHLGIQTGLRRYLVGGDYAGLDCVQADTEPHAQLPRRTPIIELLARFWVVNVRGYGINVVIPDRVPIPGPFDLGLNAVRVDPAVAGCVALRLAVADIDADQLVGIFRECVRVVTPLRSRRY